MDVIRAEQPLIHRVVRAPQGRRLGYVVDDDLGTPEQPGFDLVLVSRIGTEAADMHRLLNPVRTQDRFFGRGHGHDNVGATDRFERVAARLYLDAEGPETGSRTTG